MTTTDKLLQMGIAVALFFGVMGVILVLTSRLRSRAGERLQTAAFLAPSLLLIAAGLLYPAIKTIYQSFYDAAGTTFVGLDNYQTIVTDGDQLQVLRNTAIWVVLTPLAATLVGLVYAVLVDRAKFEKFAKALIFLPMAISLVGASIIWKFVYDYRGTDENQIGVVNQILKSVGFDTYRFLLTEPWNTLFLIVIMIWVQAGFAMTILSASIKAIPEDVMEAARLDGASALKMFRYITVPSIRPSLIVVLTTISISTLKVFDIVRTSTGGNFGTSVLAYEFYVQSFRSFNQGLGAALAVLIFVLVTPIVIYNIRQMRRIEAR
ncbi:ABC transporter [Nocardioides psychrotolerans]|uniref:Alpha-glucoside transport system permease protein n=1 Tax=Nocardioides psychrotolerans TaxID=1005945 RepID=A0A1I3II66_9ACTN|nr:sugar ABC transporter permease [Nocardioides psychrotolerans]GEP38011.1 ABC transporter [Nocardioides psychrotolerans]SFI47569.1 alpha-glucoside transport system permease protein [Nocardioides psychrotolerans]